MNLPQRSSNQELPLLDEAIFLNSGEAEKSLCVEVVRSLGIVARIALVFSRRGFDIRSLQFKSSTDEGFAMIDLSFPANLRQLQEIVRDLNKLVDVVRITVASDC